MKSLNKIDWIIGNEYEIVCPVLGVVEYIYLGESKFQLAYHSEHIPLDLSLKKHKDKKVYKSDSFDEIANKFAESLTVETILSIGDIRSTVIRNFTNDIINSML